jgi:uncharacterized protein
MHVVYLHGFASSPQSSKAQFLAERFAARGVKYLCPDFNLPDFSTLTVSRMLAQLEEQILTLPPGNVVLIGSSLGGFVAVEAAARDVSQRHPISNLVLLAPAVELEWERWPEVGPGGIERWRQTGSIEVFHFAENKPQRLNYGFYEDIQGYSPAARQLNMPVVIFQGMHDEAVSPEGVERFAWAQTNAILHLLDDGHQLKNSLDFIWLEMTRFLALDR